LSRTGADPVESAAGEIDGYDAGGFAFDALDAQPVASVEPQRPSHTPREDRGDHRDIQGDPPRAGEGVGAEVVPDRELMREPERDREVRIQVYEVPRLAVHGAARHAH